jgi:hypothetical protein
MFPRCVRYGRGGERERRRRENRKKKYAPDSRPFPVDLLSKENKKRKREEKKLKKCPTLKITSSDV